MKLSYLVVVSLLACAGAASADPVVRLRPLDSLAAEALERGVSRSTSMRKQVAELQNSDLIVYIQIKSTVPNSVAGATQLMTKAGGHRYVSISLSRELSLDGRTAILAHELQHACELARSTASDQADVRALYVAIGRQVPGKKDVFETREADEAGQRVWIELHGQYTGGASTWQIWRAAK